MAEPHNASNVSRLHIKDLHPRGLTPNEAARYTASLEMGRTAAMAIDLDEVVSPNSNAERSDVTPPSKRVQFYSLRNNGDGHLSYRERHTSTAPHSPTKIQVVDPRTGRTIANLSNKMLEDCDGVAKIVRKKKHAYKA
ncbi:hypothetical protein PCASD_01378 [Puccinia coronata f. sp. avenae]|uniref:Uncharacterized protein n=1 Tax=Puccinia coronata f. sp. avenae TaxID=200324 RepID=A0A2N5VKL7_9BASI|nr:hypothetical protein PCASD_01378 [Puccinia coronata f. sp. avenae]